MHDYDDTVYPIQIAAKALDSPPQTLRQYEREGLVSPGRTEGKMRLYSAHDMDRIRMILNLTKELGINLAGVDVIFRLQERIAEYESEIEELRAKILELGGETD